jgi:hypothetical protein
MAEMGGITPVRMSGAINKNAIIPIRISGAMAEKGWMTPVRISGTMAEKRAIIPFRYKKPWLKSTDSSSQVTRCNDWEGRDYWI